MTKLQGAFIRDFLTRAVPQALVIIVVGAALGFFLNSTRTDPLPLDLPAAQLLTESGAQVVFLGTAYELFEGVEYIFVDARPQEAFVEAHIPAAFNLPLSEFDLLYRELQGWTASQPLVVYGRASEFNFADDLARRLLESGEQEVLLMAPGFEGWVERGYPTESGEDGLLVAPREDWQDDGWDDERWNEADRGEEDWGEEGPSGDSRGEVGQSTGRPEDQGGEELE